MIASDRSRKSLDDVASYVRSITPKSADHHRKASEVVPGGTTRIRCFWPMPLFVERGSGAYLYDIDGRRYVDCNLGFGTLILGHCHPRVTQALRDQVDRGIMFGLPVTAEEALARKIVGHVPGAERIVFLNSGTEATLGAMRLARAATGRTKIAKFEGGYHGWHDLAMVSYIKPRGEPDHAESIADSAGMAPQTLEQVIALPYNDPRCLDRLRKEADNVACVILEGVQGGAGVMPIDRGLLHDLRELTKRLGILLILDEVITGFRLGASGAAGYYGISPDLVTLGKVIGGGGPVGAITGRADILDRLVPVADVPNVLMFGTFSANPMTMVAGNAQLEALLGDPGHYRYIDQLGDVIRLGIQQAFDDLKVEAHVTGLGSIWGYHFVPRVPRSRRDQEGKNAAAAKAFDGYLRDEGVFVSSPAHLAFVSTAHTREDASFVVEAHRRALERMRADGLV